MHINDLKPTRAWIMIEMSFNDYWKEKADKRRKAWAAAARRFADKHAQLELNSILARFY